MIEPFEERQVRGDVISYGLSSYGHADVVAVAQAPHVYRTALSIVTGIPEDKIHVISPDIGGGFGNEVPVYPGYVCAVVGALKLGRPVKWIETRTENLTSTGFARDYHMDIELGATPDVGARMIERIAETELQVDLERND